MTADRDDAEWARWQADYQAMADWPPVRDLRRRVVRHGRLMRVWFLFELVLTAAVLGGSAWRLALAPGAWMWAWTISVWGFTALAVAFAIINRRGTWGAGAADLSLAAQLDLTELRCRRQLRTVAVLPPFLAAEIAVVAILLATSPGRSWPITFASLAGVFLAIAAGWLVLRARTRRRLAQVTAIRAEMESGVTPTPSG
jgi:hypothetical protein